MICIATNVLAVMNPFIELADYRRRVAEMYADVRHNTLQKSHPVAHTTRDHRSGSMPTAEGSSVRLVTPQTDRHIPRRSLHP